MYNVIVSHGAKKHQLSFDESPTSEDLSSKIEAVTGVPYSRQKLIHKGKFCTSCVPPKMSLFDRDHKKKYYLQGLHSFFLLRGSNILLMFYLFYSVDAL